MSSTNKIIRSNFNGLNALVKALSDKHVVKVGIMGRKSSRKDGLVSNAELGAIHEFGSRSKNIKDRSWLRMPIHKESDKIAREAGKASNTMVKQGNMLGVLKNIGIACEAAIQRAFASHGYGTWKADKPATVRRKRSSAPLIDSGQLRRAVTSSVGTPS